MSAFNILKSFIRQFPFVYPLRMINSARDWIDYKNKKALGYKSTRQHWWMLKEQREYHVNPLPKTFGEAKKLKFNENIVYHTAEHYLFFLKHCFIVRDKGLLLSSNHYLFKEFSHHFNISSLRKFIIKHPFYCYSNGYRKINAVGAILISPESHNYYHWLFDVLPRLKSYLEIIDHIDYFCISKRAPEKFISILAHFGITKDKILLIDDRKKIQFESLYVTSLPGSEGRTPDWAISFLRSRLITTPPVNPISKRIYFTRGNSSRKIINEDFIIKFLEQNGFNIVDPELLSISEQINLMQQTNIVIGAHGAAMSNILFSKEGCRVIELFSPDYFRTDCFYTLANQLKLDYYYIVGQKTSTCGWGESFIQEEVFKTTVSKLISEQ